MFSSLDFQKNLSSQQNPSHHPQLTPPPPPKSASIIPRIKKDGLLPTPTTAPVSKIFGQRFLPNFPPPSHPLFQNRTIIISNQLFEGILSNPTDDKKFIRRFNDIQRRFSSAQIRQHFGPPVVLYPSSKASTNSNDENDDGYWNSSDSLDVNQIYLVDKELNGLLEADQWINILIKISYGHPSLQQREEIWNSISHHLKPLSQSPILICGDFNQVLFSSEKHPTPINTIPGSLNFLNFLSELGLEDLPHTGYKFS
ncbi:hypothetical protein LIER_15866 [Lithospermum erythrorhizon]|uniref:Endonuclease/exonuclease/phosphatase domain-containing protein n=1 Tax=Lithospermum erythrorhizon TaxID=34254 RepID=A0AAV3Q735_LITER